MVGKIANESVTNSGCPKPAEAKLDEATVRDLAYRFWIFRGRPIGSPDFDWFRAEAELKNTERSHAI